MGVRERGSGEEGARLSWCQPPAASYLSLAVGSPMWLECRAGCREGAADGCPVCPMSLLPPAENHNPARERKSGIHFRTLKEREQEVLEMHCEASTFSGGLEMGDTRQGIWNP